MAEGAVFQAVIHIPVPCGPNVFPADIKKEAAPRPPWVVIIVFSILPG